MSGFGRFEAGIILQYGMIRAVKQGTIHRIGSIFLFHHEYNSTPIIVQCSKVQEAWR